MQDNRRIPNKERIEKLGFNCWEIIENTPYDINENRAYLRFKRVFDIVVSLLGLVVCAIPMLLISILVYIESPGPVIFKQERLGKDGKPFVMYKFRSMYVDAENNGPQWAVINDDRCTRTGYFIRRCHADEIPQFLNVLRGEMSVVGPRPERSYFYEKFESYIPEFKERLRIKPGLTGLSQVNGCYDLLPEERLAFDIIYMRKRSVWMDIVCVLKTVVVVFNGKGAW